MGTDRAVPPSQVLERGVTDFLRQRKPRLAAALARDAKPAPRPAEMIVWGGRDWTGPIPPPMGEPWPPQVRVEEGGAYDPDLDRRRPIATAGAPAPRYWHTVVWTGEDMVVWGGVDERGSFRSGGLYDPVTDRCTTFAPRLLTTETTPPVAGQGRPNDMRTRCLPLTVIRP